MTRTAYRIDAITASRIRGKVYRSTETLADGITRPSDADRIHARLTAERPDALVVITAYAVPAL
jgi:hypothetical protein